MQAEITPEIERLLAQAKDRRARMLITRERLADGAFAAGFVAVATALALLGDEPGSPSIWLILAFMGAYALVASLPFDIGAGFLVPTGIVFVPMLLLLEPAMVPLLVALAGVAREAVQVVLRRVPRDRIVMAIGECWFALGPAAVLVIAGVSGPDWSDWPIYAGALASQFLLDGLVGCGRAYLSLGLHPRKIARELVTVYAVDALLFPVGLLAAFAGKDEPATALLVVPLAVLFRFFANERSARVEQHLELSRAYRGTALLLGDVIEDDDEYTGQHTRGVVILAGMVADELHVGEEIKRETEFGALLHDVGKIAIPKRIINKPGPLDDEEWAVMRTHTIEGQRLLERVGGILSRVGVVVRASHERWDGKGYPDGLAGQDIPLAARIVSCCDAYNAMTTDRSYRAALSVPVALAELRAHSGSQFDPQVVETVCRLIERWDPEMVPEDGPSGDIDAAIRALLAGAEDD